MTTDEACAANWFSKPVDSLLSLMRRRNVDPRDFAVHLDGGMNYLRRLLRGSEAISPTAAAAISSELGGTVDFWLRRQANYEMALDRAVACIDGTEAEGWLGRVAMPGGKARSGAAAGRRAEELRRRLAFFGVQSLSAWDERYGPRSEATRFRTSRAFTSDDSAVSMWLRQGELEAELVPTRRFNRDVLAGSLKAMRALSRIARPDRFLPRLRALCAEAGVALVVVKAPPGCRASGATRFVTADKAIVIVSFRYRSDDQFWFTFFHEIGHVLLHGGTFVDEDDTEEDAQEREANDFARDLIVPPVRQAEFESTRPAYDDVIRLSVSLGVSAGLIVGQLQHQGIIGPDRLNALKRRWTWAEIESAAA